MISMSWPSREHVRNLGWCGTVALIAVSDACQRPVPSAKPQPLPASVMLEVGASPDSTLKLAKVALTAIEGNVQLPKVRPTMTSIANHALRNRRGGGQTQVAVIAAINRQVADTGAPVTLVELSVWVLDMPQPVTPAQRRSGVPVTPITTNAPAVRHPRAMTPADTIYWKSLEHV